MSRSACDVRNMSSGGGAHCGRARGSPAVGRPEPLPQSLVLLVGALDLRKAASGSCEPPTRPMPIFMTPTSKCLNQMANPQVCASRRCSCGG